MVLTVLNGTYRFFHHITFTGRYSPFKNIKLKNTKILKLHKKTI